MPIEPFALTAMLFIWRAWSARRVESAKRFVWPNPQRARNYTGRHYPAPGRVRVSLDVLAKSTQSTHNTRFRLI